MQSRSDSGWNVGEDQSTERRSNRATGSRAGEHRVGGFGRKRRANCVSVDGNPCRKSVSGAVRVRGWQIKSVHNPKGRQRSWAGQRPAVERVSYCGYGKGRVIERRREIQDLDVTEVRLYQLGG